MPFIQCQLKLSHHILKENPDFQYTFYSKPDIFYLVFFLSIHIIILFIINTKLLTIEIYN